MRQTEQRQLSLALLRAGQLPFLRGLGHGFYLANRHGLDLRGDRPRAAQGWESNAQVARENAVQVAAERANLDQVAFSSGCDPLRNPFDTGGADAAKIGLRARSVGLRREKFFCRHGQSLPADKNDSYGQNYFDLYSFLCRFARVCSASNFFCWSSLSNPGPRFARESASDSVRPSAM